MISISGKRIVINPMVKKDKTNNIMENAILNLYHGMFMANFYIAHNLNLHGT